MHRLSKRKIVASFWELPNDYRANPKSAFLWRRKLRKDNRMMLADYLSYVWEEHKVVVQGKTRKERKRKILLLRAFRKRLISALFREVEKIINISHENGFLFQDLEEEYGHIKLAVDKGDLVTLEGGLINFADILIHEIPVCWTDERNDGIMKMRSLAFSLKTATLDYLGEGLFETTLQTFAKQGYYIVKTGCSVAVDNPAGSYEILV